MESTMDLESLDPRNLTAANFAEIQRRLGLTDIDLAKQLGMQERSGERRVRRIKRGSIECPEWMALKLIALLKSLRAGQ